MNIIYWKIKNITCNTCANTIKKCLEKNDQKNIYVNIANGSVQFQNQSNADEKTLKKSIENLGYIFDNEKANIENKRPSLWLQFQENLLLRVILAFLFSMPLLLHIFVHIDALMNPYVQFALALPVYIIGVLSFFKSAWRSLLNNSPNMDVLIIIGATAAFIYSSFGCFYLHDISYLFFETTASIFTLVLFGNWLEQRSLSITHKEVKKLLQAQSTKATMITFDENHIEHFLEVEAKNLRVGDLILIKTGDNVPADAKILSGTAYINDAVITGESQPVLKNAKDKIIGGSIVIEGSLKAQVNAVGDASVLGVIIQSVRQAEDEKAPVQLLADKISAYFIPLVLFIAGITFLANFYFADNYFQEALMRSIAVLVISCPCALGLATPAAIAVGLGIAAKNGILFRQAQSLEKCKKIKQIVFDKTGTLTTGNLIIKEFETFDIEVEIFKNIVVSIEKFSSHPIANSIVNQWNDVQPIYAFSNVNELKGIGMQAQDNEGNVFKITSQKHAMQIAANIVLNKSLYVFKNDFLVGWIDMQDELRYNAIEMIDALRKKNIAIFLISGDNEFKCKQVAQTLQIENYHFEQSQEQKIKWIEKLQLKAPTVMVGDGINDAPALAKASIGISINSASQISIEAAGIVLMNTNLLNIPKALALGMHTHRTIQENLFWAFAYNIIAIPIAAFGYLSPTFGALVMGVSDVVLAVNSARLYIKKIS